VLRMDALRVLDPRPPPAPGVPVRRQRVERAPDGPVADGVQADVELGSRASLDHLLQLRLREHDGARAVEHLRRPAAQGTVEECLDPPDPQPTVAPTGAQADAL